jgi:hypothetical protein
MALVTRLASLRLRRLFAISLFIHPIGEIVSNVFRLCRLSLIGFSFSLVQGLDRDFWRWFATIKGIELSEDAATEAEAISEAQQAIDRAIKLVGPRTN